MSDASVTDLAPFFQRYDQRNRLVFAAALSASLVMSAVIFAHGPPAGSGTGIRSPQAEWGFALLFTPVFLIGWWTFAELIALGRRQAALPDGRQPAGADDARNGVRIANAGFASNLVLTVTVVIGQALWIPFVFGRQVSAGEWIARGTMLAVGAATVYLGNLWPRMPVAREPGRTAAMRMKVNRISGWIMVMVGLLVVLLGLFLPLVTRHPAG
jgi:hypothetical protein